MLLLAALHLAQQAPATAAQLKALEQVAVIQRKVMVPMRDGIRLATDVYRPKHVTKAPTIFVRTPYNFNWWDVRNGQPRSVGAILAAVRRGYAYVVQNERERFFSEGEWDILGPPVTDGYDAIDWISKRDWATAMSPRFLSLLTLTVVPDTPLATLESRGRFVLPEVPQLLGELRAFVAEARPSDAIFRTNHASNYLPLDGRLPRDRDRLLGVLDAALAGTIPLRPEWARGL